MKLSFLDRCRTKIVATVGPACRDPQILLELVHSGVDVFRVNTAHGNRSEHQAVVEDIRAASVAAGRPVGILVDLAGPKIRLGQLQQDPLECKVGAEFVFVRGEPSGPNQLSSTYTRLIDELSVGNPVMLADGTVSMVVTKVAKDAVHCKVTGAGILRSRQGINLPGAKLSVPSMTEADRENAIWAAQQGIDFISLSFVRTPREVVALKELLRSANSDAYVIAKIEKREALDNLEEVVKAADGVMVARGDLGVEMDVAETPVAQKRIIAMCQKWRRPVIVATQMLDSMQQNRRPTRAEVTDVANAIYDGADACMLSGETAIGQFPTEAVAMMNSIMAVTEDYYVSNPPPRVEQSLLTDEVHPVTAAVCSGAAHIAQELSAKLVVIVTKSGATARIKAKQRDLIPTIGCSDNEQTLRQMCLLWGITPMSGMPVDEPPELRRLIGERGLAVGALKKGDKLVFVTGGSYVKRAHNVLVVHEVE
jgi:pyruvate kinase